MRLTQRLARKAPLAGAFLFALLLPCPGHANPQPGCGLQKADETATLDRVVDGDTIILKDGRKLRLVAINTPERAFEDRPAQPLAEQATAALQSLLPTGSTIQLQYGSQREDRHHRLLAHVFTASGRNVSAELLAQGYGFAISIPPNVRLSECYFAAEARARQARLGVWAESAYRPREASTLQRGDTGFQLVEGRVTGIGQGRKNLWIDLGSGFAIKVTRRDLGYFPQGSLDHYQGHRLRVRGWATFYNNKLRMSVGHPAMIEIVE